jgi:hypothetical protein
VAPRLRRAAPVRSGSDRGACTAQRDDDQPADQRRCGAGGHCSACPSVAGHLAQLTALAEGPGEPAIRLRSALEVGVTRAAGDPVERIGGRPSWSMSTNLAAESYLRRGGHDKTYPNAAPRSSRIR